MISDQIGSVYGEKSLSAQERPGSPAGGTHAHANTYEQPSHVGFKTQVVVAPPFSPTVCPLIHAASFEAR